jgi:hypothetical protein
LKSFKTLNPAPLSASSFPLFFQAVAAAVDTVAAHRQQQHFLKRLTQAEQAVRQLYPQATERRDEFQTRVHKLLEKQGVSDFLRVQVDEQIRYRKRYLNRGRPPLTSAYKQEEIRNAKVFSLLKYYLFQRIILPEIYPSNDEICPNLLFLSQLMISSLQIHPRINSQIHSLELEAAG